MVVAAFAHFCGVMTPPELDHKLKGDVCAEKKCALGSPKPTQAGSSTHPTPSLCVMLMVGAVPLISAGASPQVTLPKAAES